MNHIHMGDHRRGVVAWLRTGWPYPVVVAAIALANSLYLGGYAQLNPFITRSYMSSHVVRGVLPGDYTIDQNDGVTAQALGMQAIHQLLHGAIPWWNPHEGLGMPMVGEMQSAALFPLLILQALPAGFLIYHLVLELIAGLATVKLCTTLDLSLPAAVVAGCLYGLNGSLVWILNAASVPVAFLPLLLLGIERAFRSSQSVTRRGFITIGIAIWLSITAGFPEGAYLSFGLAFVYALWRLSGARGFRRGFLARTVGGSALGLTLSLPVLLAFASYLRNGANVGAHSGAFAHVAMPPGAVGMSFTPYAYGPIFALRQSGVAHVWAASGGYTTIAVVFLLLLGLWGRQHRGLRLICVTWVLVAFCKTYDVIGISALLNNVPEMTNVAVYRYMNPTVTLSMILLTALAIDDASRRQIQRWQVAVAATGSLCVLVFAWSRAHTLTAPVLHEATVAGWFYGSYGWAMLSLVVIAVSLNAIPKRRSWSLAVICGVLCIEAAGMFFVPSLSAPRGYTTDAALKRFLIHQAALRKNGSDLGRMYAVGPTPAPNYGGYFDVTFVNTNDSPAPDRWVNYVLARLSPADPSLPAGSRLGASRLIAADNSTAGYESRFRNLYVHLPGFRDAGVEYVIAPRGVPVPPYLATLLRHRLDTATSSVYVLTGAKPYASTISPNCTVRPGSDHDFAVRCPASSTLIRRELVFAGWTARVNGKSAAISEHGGVFQAVQVPQGDSTVTFSYSPTWATPSLVLSAAALLFSALVLTGRPFAAPLSRRRGNGPAHSTAVDEAGEKPRQSS
jgi:hypothetical protein